MNKNEITIDISKEGELLDSLSNMLNATISNIRVYIDMVENDIETIEDLGMMTSVATDLYRILKYEELTRSNAEMLIILLFPDEELQNQIKNSNNDYSELMYIYECLSQFFTIEVTNKRIIVSMNNQEASQ